MELKTLWLCMAAVFLVFGFVGWLKPHWFLSCAWTLHPHHISPETIAHLHGGPEVVEQIDEADEAETAAFDVDDDEAAVALVMPSVVTRPSLGPAMRDVAAWRD
jgi:hypothetical protein